MAVTRRKVQGIAALVVVFGLLLVACGGGGSSNAKAKTGKNGSTLPACPPGTGPYKVAAYVANGGSGDVTPIDDATHAAGTPIKVAPATLPPGNTNPNNTARIAGPFDIAAMPDGSAVWVAVRNTNQAVRIGTDPGDAATYNKVTNKITVGADPRGITVSPDNHWVVVASFGSSSITMIDTTVNPPKASSVPVKGGTVDVVVDPTSKFALFTAVGQVKKVDLALKQLTGTTPVGGYRLAMRPDGSSAYVALPSGTLNDPTDVIPVSQPGAPGSAGTAQQPVTLTQKPLQGNDSPWEIITSHDGKTAWVGMLNGLRVIPVDLTKNPPVEKPPATYNTLPEVNVGGGAIYGLDITPDDKTLYVPRSFKDDVQWVDVSQATPTAKPVTGYTGASPDAVAVVAGCQSTTSSSSTVVSTSSTSGGGSSALPCTTIAPIPSGATDVNVASVMWDGSHVGSLRVYQLNGTWHARGEMQAKPFDDEVIDGPGPTMKPIGGYRINNDATEEGWVNVGQGSSTDILTFFVYQNCKIGQIQLNGSAALFPVGATTSAAQGVSCFGFNTGIEVFDTTSNDGDHYNGTSKVYTIQLGTPPKLILGATSAQSESATAGGNAFQALSTFHCGNLTI